MIGRAEGLLSWILALLKIDPITSIKVLQDRVEFAAASLSATEHHMIPIGNVCSTNYGYHKPWKMALLIFLFLAWFNIPGGLASLAGNQAITLTGFILDFFIAAGLAILYYSSKQNAHLWIC